MPKPRQAEFVKIRDAELAAKLKKWSEDHGGKIPTQNDLRDDKSMPSPTAYINHFGKWKEALKAAGLDRKEVQKKELTKKIQELIDEGIKPTSSWMLKNDHKLVLYHAIKLYGSWSSAMIEMGFAKVLDDAELQDIADKLNELHDKLGRTPVKADIIADVSLPHFDTCIRKFGSASKMYKAAGLSSPKRGGKNQWSKAPIPPIAQKNY